MRTQEHEAVVAEDSAVLFPARMEEEHSLEDELFGEERFFTTLEALVARGQGPLIVVR
ncbi:MAG: hypothetical protein R3B48_13365 [Kofleriaceae bacterium]